MEHKYGIKAKTMTSHMISSSSKFNQWVRKQNFILSIMFSAENNHENLEHHENNPFDYYLQSTAWLPSYYKQLSHNTAGNTCSMLRGQSQFMIYFRLLLELNLVCQTGM
jgi:hypothetical protein